MGARETSAPCSVASSSGSPTLQLRGRGDEALDELVVDRSLDEDPRAAQADLALVGEGGAKRAGHRLVEIGVGEDDGGVLAAQLERELLEQRRRDARRSGAGRGAAGERDRAARRDARRAPRRPRPRPVDEVEHAGRQAASRQASASIVGGHRRQLGRLGHDGVAGRPAPARSSRSAGRAAGSTARSARRRRAAGAGCS